MKYTSITTKSIPPITTIDPCLSCLLDCFQGIKVSCLDDSTRRRVSTPRLVHRLMLGGWFRFPGSRVVCKGQFIGSLGGPPKIGFFLYTPKKNPFVHRVWNHEINHPFWGFSYFWKHPCHWKNQIQRNASWRLILTHPTVNVSQVIENYLVFHVSQFKMDK